jgi:outer membrane protein OmpA-like peptidoglycan-associated protein
MAPAAGQAAALPPREDIVFFSLGSAQLTPDARNAIREAVADAKQHNLKRVQVTGHTDTLGAAESNERLSWRRADAVAQEIVAQGVPRDQIDVVGRGETDPPVKHGEALCNGRWDQPAPSSPGGYAATGPAVADKLGDACRPGISAQAPGPPAGMQALRRLR